MRNEKVLKKYKPGGLFSGQRLKLTATMLRYEGGFTGNFIVPRSDIETVTVERDGFLHDKLKIVGRGTTLAEAKLYRIRAEKAQAWILRHAKL